MRNTKHIKTTLKALSICVVMGLPALASADVLKITDDATLQQQQGERYFSQSGVSGEVALPLETAGADMSLSIATKLIIPDSWVIKPSGNFDRAVVSWQGGVAWPHILRNIAQNEGIFISLDWIQKIASIHVPGKTSTEDAIDSSSKTLLADERQAFRKKQREQWEVREDRAAELGAKDKLFDDMLQKQRKAQIANQELIAQLNNANSNLERDLSTLQDSLALEQKKRESIEEKFSVIDPTLKSAGGHGVDSKLDAVDLFEKFNGLWVKPLDDSFEYYKNGGHADRIEAQTPATYIAKTGSIEEVVTQWANAVGWHVEYTAGVQHYNPFQVTFKGTFVEASIELLRIFEKSNRPLNIKFHPDVVVNMPDGTVRHGLVKIIDLNYTR